MSLQDDMFDVEAALYKMPEEASFNRLMKWFGRMEMENEKLRTDISTLKAAIKIVKEESS